MLFSAFRWFGYVGPGWLADIGDGTLYTRTWGAETDNFSLRGWHGGSNRDVNSSLPFAWTLWWWGREPMQMFGGPVGPSLHTYSIWPAAPLLALAGAGLLWIDRSGQARLARLNLCMNCAYPRERLSAGAPCPECGGAEAGTDRPVAERGRKEGR